MIKRLLRILLFSALLVKSTHLLYLQQAGTLKEASYGNLFNITHNIPVPTNELSKINIETKINNFRVENGLNSLDHYSPLCELAEIRVQEIKTDWSHKGFEDRGRQIYTEFCNNNQIMCTNVGENLAKGKFSNEKELVQGWADSEGHRENMLGKYNVQCVAVSENHYVSLFAYTENLETIRQQQLDLLNSKVEYNYESVLFWENQIKLNEKYKSSWESGRGNPHYNEDGVDTLLKIFDTKLELSYKLWDGYTNSKVTKQEASSYEAEYWVLANDSAKLSKELNNNAYKECIKSDINENICKKYEN